MVTDTSRALSLLQQAAKLHMGHIKGSEPTSPESQQRLMDLIDAAIEALGGSGGEGEHNSRRG